MKRSCRMVPPDRLLFQLPMPGSSLRSRVLWLVAAFWLAVPGFAAAQSCTALERSGKLPLSYDICPLSTLPPVFSEPELAALFTRLKPGQDLEVTEMFLRVAQPWPYLDIRGPGAMGGGGDMPNEPRAVFLLRADHPAATEPLLLVAPARLKHRLRAVAGGGTPRDSWRITAGPFAPTLYGQLRRGSERVAITAHPTADPIAGGKVRSGQRAALVVQIIDFFVSE